MPYPHGQPRLTTVRSTLLRATVLAAVFAGAPVDAAPADCANPAKSLGVSRVLEVDTSQGPRLGQQQYKETDFLAPGEVVLTFDDGPLRIYTQPILNALDAQCTKATFFMVGSQAVADPEMVRRVIAKGHTVGNHTWSHANLPKFTPLKARQEIELGLSAVTAAAGQPISPFFRFPYLAHTKAMLGYTQTRQFGVFSIDVDSQDWKTKNAASVHRDVLNQLADLGKGIILFHDIQPATAQALPGLLEALRVKGYRVVQLKSKSKATTIPEFDALARDVKARNQVASATQPLFNRGMTWGAAQPGVLGQAVPAQGTRHAAVNPNSPAAGTVAPARPAPYGALYGSAPQAPPAPFGGAAAGSVPVYPGDPQGAPRVVRQRPPEDWRDKVFGK